jgi:hypothetical protein
MNFSSPEAHPGNLHLSGWPRRLAPIPKDASLQNQSDLGEAFSITIDNLPLGLFEHCFHLAAPDRLVESCMIALVLVRVCDRKFS